MADVPESIRVQASSISGESFELEFRPAATVADLRAALERDFAWPREYLTICVGSALLAAGGDGGGDDAAPLAGLCASAPRSVELQVAVVKALEPVLQEMASEDAIVQDRVLERLIQTRSLPQLHDRRALQVLLDRVADQGVGRARGYVAVALRQLLASYDNPCQPELLALLDHEHAEVRQRGVEALGLSVVWGCADAVEAVRACLEDPVLSVRSEAIVALMHLGDAEPAMVPSLVAEHIMSGSVRQLMEYHYSALRQGLDTPQQAAQKALASMAAIAFYRDVRTFSPHSLRKLVEYAKDESADAGVRGSALEVLWYLLHTQDEKGIANGLLAAYACIAHRSAVVRHMAIRLIGTHGFRAGDSCAEQAMQALHEALKDEDGRVQQQALEDIQARVVSTEDADWQRALKITLAESTRYLWSLKHMVTTACAGSAGSNGSWLCHYAS